MHAVSESTVDIDPDGAVLRHGNISAYFTPEMLHNNPQNVAKLNFFLASQTQFTSDVIGMDSTDVSGRCFGCL